MENLNVPVVPQNITVHLGAPDTPAPNVTLPFVEYIKNVASNEIYPTWDTEALKANIYAITSFALNRIYTEYYPSRGYDFDITNDTRFDQAFQNGGEIFDNIGKIVDEQFNSYIVRDGAVEPLFAQFCNGTTSTCNGLSQWGTVPLAESGLSAVDILKNFYGNDIKIVQNAPVGDTESYDGIPLKLGSSGNAVKTVQQELNRIRNNYPAIPQIARIDGVFGKDTEDAVKKFQQIFSLTPDGIVGKATWYKLKRYYTAVKSLSDLVSEGVSLEEARLPYPTVLSAGSSGTGVSTLQYYLNLLAFFNPQLMSVNQSGNFDAETVAAVKTFQEFYGVNPTGRVGAATWKLLEKAYREAIASLPREYETPYAAYYDGYVLSEGSQGESVAKLQTYLSKIATQNPAVPPIPVTGYFGPQTRDAVIKFQTANSLEPTGTVGAATWGKIAAEYDRIIESGA